MRALNNMSRKRIGALIVFERHTGLADVIDSGTVIDGEISAPLIENIFEPNTPLHDGAVIVRGERIVAAACILQLTDDHSLSRELGTRHRAAIGITESTDAVSVIVSEETGIISMARDGKLTRYLDTKSLNILLTELFMPDDLPPACCRPTRPWRARAPRSKRRMAMKDKLLSLLKRFGKAFWGSLSHTWG